LSSQTLYEERADVYDCCIKLLTDTKYAKERWEESFYPMSAHSFHGRMVVTEEKDERQRVLYDHLSMKLIKVNYERGVRGIREMCETAVNKITIVIKPES